MIELFGHPFSSYTWKALIALWEKDLPFTYHRLEGNAELSARLKSISPIGKFPLLVDGETMLPESSIIIEYLDSTYPHAPRFIPADANAALNVRLLDRLFDLYVMDPAAAVVREHIIAPDAPDAGRIAHARARLREAYAMLEPHVPDAGWIGGSALSMADISAAPALFYADWIEPIGGDCPRLAAYRQRLLAQPSIKRAVDEARPYRSYFPPGAPDRD